MNTALLENRVAADAAKMRLQTGGPYQKRGLWVQVHGEEVLMVTEPGLGCCVHGPQMVGAENIRASLGSQPVQPDVINQ